MASTRRALLAASWDGRYEVASGVYLARLRLAERSFAQPLTPDDVRKP